MYFPLFLPLCGIRKGNKEIFYLVIACYFIKQSGGVPLCFSCRVGIDIHCGKVIKKSEIYERNLFTSKNTKFKQEDFLDEIKLFYTRMINRWVTDEKDKLTVFDRNGPYLATKKVGKNNPKAEQIEQDNKLRMDWNREVDRTVISEVPIEDILQIKREHITEPVKRSIEQYGNKPEMLSLILNMAIAELVLLITKVLEAIKGIHSRQQRENAPEDKNKAQRQDNGILTADALPPEPVMTPETAAYPKLKKIKTELDSLRECRNAYADYQRQYES